jgi:hypothetical protein
MAVTSATFFIGSSQCLTGTVSLNQYSACLVSRHSQLGTSPARYLQQEERRGVVSLASMLSLIVASIWADWAFIWALNSYLLRATRARRLPCGVPRGSGAGVPPLHTLLELLCQGLLLGLQGTLLLGLQPSPLYPPLSLHCLAVLAPPNLLFRVVGGRGDSVVLAVHPRVIKSLGELSRDSKHHVNRLVKSNY